MNKEQLKSIAIISQCSRNIPKKRRRLENIFLYLEESGQLIYGDKVNSDFDYTTSSDKIFQKFIDLGEFSDLPTEVRSAFEIYREEKMKKIDISEKTYLFLDERRVSTSSTGIKNTDKTFYKERFYLTPQK